MNRFKQDIWSLHHVIFLFCAVYFMCFCTMEWDKAQEFHSYRQSERVKSVSDGVSGILSSQQASMRLLIDYLKTGNIKDGELKSFLQLSVKQDAHISSIYIVNEEKNLVVSSGESDISYNKFQELVINTSPSILSGLNQLSSPMLIGQSQKPGSISLIMPFTEHARAKPSLLVFVADAAPDQSFFDISIQNQNDSITAILDSAGNKISGFSDNHNNRFLNSFIENFEKLKLSARITDIELPEENQHFEYYQGRTSIKNERFFYSMMYNRDFHIWTISVNNYHSVYNDFIEDIVPSFLGFSAIQFFFFALVWRTSRKEKSVMEKLVHQANHDYLTNLPNRYFVRAKFEEWSKDNKDGSTIMIIGLDRFKNVNDIQGQLFADNLLVEVAERLQSMNFGRSIVARENGDEFLILSSVTDEKEVNKLADSVVEEIAKPYSFSTKSTISMSCSIGVAIYPDHGKSIEQLIRCSAIAMDVAKKEKGIHVVFNDEMIHSHMFKATIENRLRMALRAKSITLSYQPQVNSDGSLYGVEALVRWNDEMLGVVRPDIFISVAEECGLIYELGKQIKFLAMSQMKMMQDKYDIKFQTSINISVKQINNMEFVNNIKNIANQTGFPLDKLTLEITESVFADNIEMVNMKFNALRELGVKVSLDDFGTGYSSLSMLNNISIDELKIDKSFIDHIATDERASRMVQSIITLGKNFDSIVLAEGIESKRDHDSLVEMGCDLFQGYYFSKPLPIEDFDLYLNSNVNQSHFSKLG